MIRMIHRFELLASFGLLCAGLPAEIIISEDFAGSGSLDTTTPDVTPGGDWVAASQFGADGVISSVGTGSSSGGSATVAFTPVDGQVYTLDASFTGVTGNANWVALGFGEGQSTVTTFSNRFINGSLIGKAWMIFRGQTTEFGNTRFSGSATNGTTGTSAQWSPDFSGGGDIDLRIELDTTGGAGNWSATWFAKRPGDASYTEVGAAPLEDEVITSVGIAQSSGDTTATITSFSLSDTPSVSAPTILGLSRNATGDLILTLDGPADGLQAQKSDDLDGFTDVSSTASGNTLTVPAVEIDLDGNGTEFYRVRE